MTRGGALLREVIPLQAEEAIGADAPEPSVAGATEREAAGPEEVGEDGGAGVVDLGAPSHEEFASLCPFCCSRARADGSPCCAEAEAIGLMDSPGEIAVPATADVAPPAIVAPSAVAASVAVAAPAPQPERAGSRISLSNVMLLVVALLASSVGAMSVLLGGYLTAGFRADELDQFARWERAHQLSDERRPDATGVEPAESSRASSAAPSAPIKEPSEDPGTRVGSAESAPAATVASAAPAMPAAEGALVASQPAASAPVAVASVASPPSSTAHNEPSAAPAVPAPEEVARSVAARQAEARTRAAAAAAVIRAGEARVDPTLLSPEERIEWLARLNASPNGAGTIQNPSVASRASASMDASRPAGPIRPSAGDPRWSRIRRGMSKEGVRQILGDPKATDDNSLTMEFWLYDEERALGSAWIAFSRSDGQVFSWHKP